jgi:6-phospho-3-hexuloisomerase
VTLASAGQTEAKDLFDAALAALAAVSARIAPEEIDTACATIVRARRIVIYGCGREGLQLRGFAMRLHHLGLQVAVQGDMAAPPVGPGDLLVVSAGPGELPTVTALMRVAREAGAAVLFLTAEPATPSAALADHMLVVPAQTMARDSGPGATSLLPMGSVYEGALFLLFEIMVLRLGGLLGVTPAAMRARHTNLE